MAKSKIQWTSDKESDAIHQKAAVIRHDVEPTVKTKKASGSVKPAAPGKGYTPPPQQGGRADKVSGTSSAAGAKNGLSFGTGGKKLGNHYSNS